jgi:fatty-acyl-CoA synthase
MTENSKNRSWLRALKLTGPIGRDPYRTLPSTILELTQRLPDSPAVISTGETLTYQGLGKRIDYYTLWGLRQQLAKGDVVGLLMQNCPDYVAIWLGLTRIGCIVGLVNTNLRSTSLAQVISLISPKHVIVGASLAADTASLTEMLNPNVGIWVHGANFDKLQRIDEQDALLDTTISPLILAARAPSVRDRALYLYTSGTTGLPKAVPVSHYRLMQWSFWFAGMIGVKAEDRMYNCLPMYHSVGGIVANGAMLVSGGSVVVREKFSAKRFWSDIEQTDCTLVQYIGEMCRYLVNNSPEPHHNNHRIRLACGNGLRRAVWEDFQQRFAIPRILEFYAATEGNFSLYNVEGRPGSIGRIPGFLAHRFPMALVKFDVDRELPMRGEDGFCMRCTSDEPGEAIGLIPGDKTSQVGQFEGYLDPIASDKKILRNVFVPGDAWYRTGDLMRRDNAGFFYFVDRIGDSFRWKGENVSCDEVAEVVASCAHITGAVAYGVEIPDHEGRAGMASIVASAKFDLRVFEATLAERLPDYARPVFLRVLSEIEVTGTFKPQKQRLIRDGYDISAVLDPIYLRDRKTARFSRLDAAGLAAIKRGDIQF